jgi:hypothetical protein
MEGIEKMEELEKPFDVFFLFCCISRVEAPL